MEKIMFGISSKYFIKSYNLYEEIKNSYRFKCIKMIYYYKEITLAMLKLGNLVKKLYENGDFFIRK